MTTENSEKDQLWFCTVSTDVEFYVYGPKPSEGDMMDYAREEFGQRGLNDAFDHATAMEVKAPHKPQAGWDREAIPYSEDGYKTLGECIDELGKDEP